MTFLHVIFKNVLRRKVRSMLTVGGMAVAVMAVVSLVAFSSGFERSWVEQYQGRGVDIIASRAGRAEALGGNLDAQVAETIAAMKNVGGRENVTEVLTDRINLGAVASVGTPLHGMSANSFVMQAYKIRTGGRRLTNSDEDRNSVILGRELAESLSKTVGEKVEVDGERPYQVVGIFESKNRLENNSAVMRLDVVQELLQRPGQVNTFQLRLDPSISAEDREASASAVCKVIESLKDEKGRPYGLAAKTAMEYVRQTAEIRMSHAMAWMTSVLAIILGVVGMLNTMVMAVLERTQEIGILRAIGWRRMRIQTMILGETFVLSLAGAAVGTAAGFLAIQILSYMPQAGGLVRADISLWILGMGLGLSLVVGFLGGYYPAWRGARLQPTEALRYE